MAGDSPRFLQALLAGQGAEAVRTRVQEEDLQQWGLTGEAADGGRESRVGAGKSRALARRRRPMWDAASDSSRSAFPCRQCMRTHLLQLEKELLKLRWTRCRPSLSSRYLMCYRVKPTCPYEPHVWGTQVW